MLTAMPLIRLGGCPGWSELLLWAQVICLFCHAAAHFIEKKPSKWKHNTKREVFCLLTIAETYKKFVMENFQTSKISSKTKHVYNFLVPSCAVKESAWNMSVFLQEIQVNLSVCTILEANVPSASRVVTSTATYPTSGSTDPSVKISGRTWIRKKTGS